MNNLIVNTYEKTCEVCKNAITSGNAKRKYCSNSCKTKAYELRQGRDGSLSQGLGLGDFIRKNEVNDIIKKVSTDVVGTVIGNEITKFGEKLAGNERLTKKHYDQRQNNTEAKLEGLAKIVAKNENEFLQYQKHTEIFKKELAKKYENGKNGNLLQNAMQGIKNLPTGTKVIGGLTLGFLIWKMVTKKK